MKGYRILNQVEGNWSMDISYIIKAGLLSYDDINVKNFEQLAAGSKEFLMVYKPKVRLYFNNIPKECLIDVDHFRYENIKGEACEICGDHSRFLYKFYDLRVKMNTAEMVLVGTKNICGLCQKTIFLALTGL